MILHTVLFRLNRPIDDAAKSAFLDELHAFAAEAPLVQTTPDVFPGLSLRPDNPRGADVMFQASFADADAFLGYIEHERHLRLVRDVVAPSCEGWWSTQIER
jgi:hypothetical protein